MALAPLLARGISADSATVDAATALQLATSSGAAAIGLDVGSLTAGKPADIVRLDLDHPALAPLLDDELLTAVVFAGGPHLVTDVWVDGVQVVSHRTITTVDTDAVVADATIRARRIANDA